MDSYGGTTLPEEVVHSIGEQIQHATLGLHHDPRRRLDARLVETSYAQDEDGYLQLIATYEVDEDAWIAGGGATTKGFSFTGFVPVQGEGETKRETSISADAHWFSDEQLARAFESLKEKSDSAAAFRLYQFAAEPDALIILNFMLTQLVAVGPGVAASWLYDTLKHFIGSQPSIFSIEVSDPATGKTARAYVRTNSSKVLRHAMDTIPDALLMGGNHEYNEDDQEWHQD